MLSIGGTWDTNEATTLLLMPGLAAYAVAVVVAAGLWLWSRRDHARAATANGRGDVDLLASARAKEHRDLALIALAPLLLLIVAPGLLVVHPMVSVAALVVFLMIASVVFRQLLRVISGTA